MHYLAVRQCGTWLEVHPTIGQKDAFQLLLLCHRIPTTSQYSEVKVSKLFHKESNSKYFTACRTSVTTTSQLYGKCNQPKIICIQTGVLCFNKITKAGGGPGLVGLAILCPPRSKMIPHTLKGICPAYLCKFFSPSSSQFCCLHQQTCVNYLYVGDIPLNETFLSNCISFTALFLLNKNAGSVTFQRLSASFRKW